MVMATRITVMATGLVPGEQDPACTQKTAGAVFYPKFA